jgi:hypothetical protein
MTHIYKRAGYEFQVVKTLGAVSRAIGRKGTKEMHDVIHDGKTYTFTNAAQAVEKFEELTEKGN